MHAIDTALESRIFENIIVSSDDPDILEQAYSARLESRGKFEAPVIIHRRPRRLADDRTQIKHVCKFLLTQCYKPSDVFCLLTPCNPFRTAEDLRKAYDLLWKRGANYVMSVVRATPPPQWAMRRKGWFIEPFMGHEYLKQAQRLEPLYIHDGGFIFARTRVFLKEFDMDFRGSKCLPYIMRRSCDIDTADDLALAEVMMRRLLDGKQDKELG